MASALQVAEFVAETSGDPPGPANPNLYYVNAVGNEGGSSTGEFSRNTEGDVITAILEDIGFPEGVDIVGGIDDLRSQFTSGMAADALGGRFAVIVTNGLGDPEAVLTAAQLLKESLVAVIALAPPGFSDFDVLQEIASSPDLVLVPDSVGDIADLLLATLPDIGTPDSDSQKPSANELLDTVLMEPACGTFRATCSPYGRHSTPSCMASALCYPLHCVWWCTQHHACTIDRCYGSFLNVCTVETGHTAWEV